jgi:uncharacterized protein YndB with AHSA1/START domain
MRRLFVAVLAVAVLSWLSAVDASADSALAGAPVITPPLAGAVVDDVWSRREAALVARDAAGLDGLETDGARALDHAWIDGANTGLPASALPRTISGRFVLVPRQYAYPAWFIGVIVYQRANEPNWVYTEVTAFARSGAAEPWKLAVEAYPPVTKDFRAFVPDPQSDDFASVAAADLGLPLQDLPPTVAHRWPGWRTTSAPASNVYAVGLASGSALACFGLTYEKVEARPWWYPLHLRRANLGLAAGYYRRSVTTYVENRCVLDRGLGEPAGYTDVAQRAAYVARSGLPAQPMPWLPIGLLGLTLSAGFGLLALRVRPGPRAPAASHHRPVSTITLKAYQRRQVLQGLPLLLGGALAAIGVEQFLIELDIWWAITFPIVVIPVLVVPLLPRSRRFVARATVAIARPPGAVFAIVADPPSQPAWYPEVTEVHATSEGPVRAGTTCRQRQRLRDGRIVEVESAVTEFVPGRRYATRLLKSWDEQTTQWTFRPVAEGTQVEVTVRHLVGPIRAMSGLGFRQGWQLAATQRWEKALADLKRFVEDGTPTAARESSGPVFVRSRHRALEALATRFNLRPGWRLSILSLVFTAAIFAAINPWFALGLVGLLAIHEFAHYVQTASDGRNPEPPVFLILGAFVMPRRLPTEAIEDARGKLVGPLMATVACAGLVTLYAFVPDWQFLPWIVAGAAINLIGSVAPSTMMDSGAILLVIGRWLPLTGLVIGGALAAGSMVIGVPSLILIPAALLYTTGLALQVGPQHGDYWSTLRTRGRLAFAAAWTVMVLYLGLTGWLAAFWL